MPGNSPLIDGSGVLILLLLAARAAFRLGRDRLWNDGEAAHLAMAFGMALMLIPIPHSRPLLAVLFIALVLFEASVWTADRFRRSDGPRFGHDHGQPEHVLELHHVVVGGAMAFMALRHPSFSASSTAASMPGASAMPGMIMGAGSPSLVAITLFAYAWLSVLVLGGGLARAFRAEPPGPQGLSAVLGAPSTVYACELAMTVIMGLMLLA